MVPLQVIFGDETFRDRVELKPEEFYRRLRERRATCPTTSQPAPADFVRVLRDAGREADEVVARAARSATCRGPSPSAQAAVRAGRHQRGPPGGQPVRLAGRRDAGTTGGGVGGGRVDRGGDRARSWSGSGAGRGCCSPWTGTTTCSGPDGSPAARRGSAGMLDVKPILSLDADRPGGPGRPGARPGAADARVLALLERRLTPRPRCYASGWRTRTRPRWPSGSGRRWSRPTGRGTVS